LCTITVSEACNMTLAANSTRGGVVRIGGGAVAANFAGGPITGQTGPACWNHPCFTYGDANADGAITAMDVQKLVATWGKMPGEPGYDPCGDLNQDGVVTAMDVQVLVQNWGKSCPQ
jgi:hypothetical protein